MIEAFDMEADRLLMPLVTTDEQMAEGLDILEAALAAVSVRPAAEFDGAH